MAELDDIKHELFEIDKKSNELIEEFQSHYLEYIEQQPEDKNRRDEIFQSWVIQKIAGLQYSILKMAEKFNVHIENHK